MVSKVKRPRVRVTEPRTRHLAGALDPGEALAVGFEIGMAPQGGFDSRRVGHVEYDFVEHQIITLRSDDFGRRWVDRQVEPEVMQYYPELLAEPRFNVDTAAGPPRHGLPSGSGAGAWPG